MHQLMYRVCADVLATAVQLPTSTQLPAPTELRQQLITALDKVVSRGRRANIPDQDLAEARYALVAFLDEQVGKASWSGRAEWMARPLQFELYRDNNAGEDFFVRLNALIRSGDRPLAVQIYYVCLSLGFRGTYATKDSSALGKFVKAARQQLASVLPPPDELSPHGLPRQVARAVTTRRGPLLAIVSAGVLLIALVIGLASWSVQRELGAALAEMAGSAPRLRPTAP
jgi:type VI secretion system protein ImpK